MHALWILDRDLSGDRPTHGVPDEHGVRKTQRIHEGDRQAGVSSVVVGDRRLVGKTEAAVVERDHAKACRGHGCEILAPRVHRGAEAVQEDDRNPAPNVDVADSRSVDQEVAGGELGPGGEQLRLGQGGGPAAGEGAEDQEEKAPHARARIQARATTCMIRLAAARPPETLRVSGSEGPVASRRDRLRWSRASPCWAASWAISAAGSVAR